MTDLPKGWRVYKGDGVEGQTREERADTLKTRFSETSKTALPKPRDRRRWRQVLLVVLIAFLAYLAWRTMPGASPF